MTEAVAANIWLGVGAYATVGVVVTLVLMLGALKRLDPLAAAAPLRVKALIAPGLIALWPLVLARLFSGRPA